MKIRLKVPEFKGEGIVAKATVIVEVLTNDGIVVGSANFDLKGKVTNSANPYIKVQEAS